MQEKTVYGALTVYRERGAYLRRLDLCEKAKISYEEAYKHKPDDVRLLSGLSRVYSDAVQPSAAYDIAEKALQIEPENMTAKQTQAHALYTLSEFELSVVVNARGLRQRKKPSYFYEGINQGIETIQDCIGKRAGPVLVDFLPIIADVFGNDLDDTTPRKPAHISRIPQLKIKKKFTHMQIRKHENLAHVLAMKYLGPLAEDKAFLQDLLKDPRLKSVNTAGSNKLMLIVKDALKTLGERQEMLRKQRPYYAVKAAEKTLSNHQEKFKMELLENERKTGARISDLYLKQISKCIRETRINDMLAAAERMQSFLDTKTPHTLPDKKLYTEKLYKYVGEGYLLQHRLSYKISAHSNKQRIAFLMGLPVDRPKSYDSVRANYPHKRCISEAIKKALARLEICDNPYKRCWLTYELAHLYCGQKNISLSKFYARHCQRQAAKIDSPTWWLNGCFVLMSGDMQHANVSEVRAQVAAAFEWTKTAQNRVGIENFLKKCAELVEEMQPPTERTLIQQREKEILKVFVDKESRNDAGLLLKRISMVPQGRRFTVLPTHSANHNVSERQKYKQRGLSIVPGPPKKLPNYKSSEVKGFQIFRD